MKALTNVPSESDLKVNEFKVENHKDSLRSSLINSLANYESNEKQ